MKIFVSAKPQAKEARIEKLAEDHFRIWVKAKAEDGKANQAVLEALAAYLKVSPGRLTMLSGQKSRKKVVGFS